MPEQHVMLITIFNAFENQLSHAQMTISSGWMSCSHLLLVTYTEHKYVNITLYR